MKKENISIATITWARDEGEEKLLRESLGQLSKLNIPVFITDGGSGRDFLDFLRSIPHFTLLQAEARGVWAQAKNSLLAAYQADSKFIFYTEPDKFDFFQQHVETIFMQASGEASLGILLASRSDAGFLTFPPFQRMTETTINQCCAEVMGKIFDYTYGPFLLNRQLVPYLKWIKEDIGWGWRPYTFMLAHRLGLSIEGFSGDFYCPEDQRQDDQTERIYRMKQMAQNMEGLAAGAAAVL